MNEFSVLMSVYKKENPAYLKKAFSSLLTQTVVPNEIVLVEDGPLTEELYKVIDEFKQEYENLKIVALEKQSQLGKALQAGLEACSYELVARMDTDDICRPYRFESQLKYLENNKNISVVGGDIAEFYEEDKTERIKQMPSSANDVRKYARYRCPLNHMTVMFKKSDVLDAGGYQHFPGLEDYHLWIRMLAKDYQLANIPEILVDVRLGENFADRRGGKEYTNRYMELRQMQHDLGLTNDAENLFAKTSTYIMTSIPSSLRDKVYRILRK